MDDYKFGDDNGTKSNYADGDDAKEFSCKYEENSKGFGFAADGKRIAWSTVQKYE